MPIDRALEVAHQIALALESAHEKGIIHRDLKPANIKITPEGQAIVLDFGLAKAMEDDEESSVVGSASLSPTLTAQMTKAGVLLGTAAYMSPEQARGQAIDKRADNWAFGCVVLEMLSGRQVFAGDTPEIEGSVSSKNLSARPNARPWIFATLALGLAAGILGFLALPLPPVPREVLRAQIPAPKGNSFDLDVVTPQPPVFSPDSSGSIFKVREEGGEVSSVTENSHRFPLWLPDQEHFLYLARVTLGAEAVSNKIMLTTLDGPEPRLLLNSPTNVVLASGRLLFVRENTLMVQEFDAERLGSGRRVPAVQRRESRGALRPVHDPNSGRG